MRRSILVFVLSAACMTFVASPLFAITWTACPDGAAGVFGAAVVDGVTDVNTESVHAHAEGTFYYEGGLPAYGTSFTMSFDADLYAWDAYTMETASGGRLNAFVVTAGTEEYYWKTLPADPGAPSEKTLIWNGMNAGDVIRGNYLIVPDRKNETLFTNPTATTVYVNLMFDSVPDPDRDALPPSGAGRSRNSTASVPEPMIMLLIGSGLLGLAFFTAKKK